MYNFLKNVFIAFLLFSSLYSCIREGFSVPYLDSIKLGMKEEDVSAEIAKYKKNNVLSYFDRIVIDDSISCKIDFTFCDNNYQRTLEGVTFNFYEKSHLDEEFRSKKMQGYDNLRIEKLLLRSSLGGIFETFDSVWCIYSDKMYYSEIYMLQCKRDMSSLNDNYQITSH